MPTAFTRRVSTSVQLSNSGPDSKEEKLSYFLRAVNSHISQDVFSSFCIDDDPADNRKINVQSHRNVIKEGGMQHKYMREGFLFNHASSTHQQSFHDDLRARINDQPQKSPQPKKLTSRFCVLAPDTEAPEMTKTTMRTNLFEALQVITKLRVHSVRENLGILPVNNILLPVQEPCGDFVLSRVLDDSDDTLEFIRVEFTSTTQHEKDRTGHALEKKTHRLLRSTSAFLQTMFA